jgi:hypothetical protein
MVELTLERHLRHGIGRRIVARMPKDFGKRKFKQFAKTKRLRLVRSEDGLPIVVSRGKEWAGCHLFEGFGNGYVGLYVVRDTTFKMSHVYGALCRMGLEPMARGDWEGTFKVPYKSVMKVARKFKMVKRKVNPK